MSISVTPVSAAFVQQGDRFLLTQRLPDRGDPLKWEFPGGKLEAGETPEEALVREIREELGMEISVGRVLDVRLNGSYLVMFYACTVVSGAPVCRECSAAGFFTREEALALDMIPQDRMTMLRILSANSGAI